MSGPRDLRIDFFRGLAMLFVVIDHLEAWSGRLVVIHWTPMSIGLSDAAEIFVFLSGYVLAIAYSSTLERYGLGACLKKAFRRSRQIYVAYLLACIVLIGVSVLLFEWHPPKYNDDLQLGERPWASLLAALVLMFHPWGSDILAFYIVILPPMAALFWLRRRNAPLAWSISIGLYLFAQVFPQVNVPKFNDVYPWFFNPFAWQLLFFIGTYLGDPQTRDPQTRRPALAPRWLLVPFSLAVLAVGFFSLKGSYFLAAQDFENFKPFIRTLLFGWSDKNLLGPARLLHFFSLVYLASLVAPRGMAFWTRRWTWPLVVLGQNSLEAFAFGIVLVYFGVFAIQLGFDSTPQILLLDVLMCAGSIAFAFVIQWKNGASLVPPRVEVAVSPAVTHTAKRGRRKKTGVAGGVVPSHRRR